MLWGILDGKSCHQVLVRSWDSWVMFCRSVNLRWVVVAAGIGTSNLAVVLTCLSFPCG